VRVTAGVFDPRPDADVIIKGWIKKAEELGSEVLGTSAVPLRRNYNGESELGDVIADAMLWKTHAQVAFENAGGIRGDIDAGPITRGELITAAPFINSLYTMKLTGAQIRQVLEQSLTLKVGMMQVAGLRARYDLGKPEYQRLVSVEIAGQSLQDNKTYSVATNSFVALGGDHYEMFKDGTDRNDTGLLVHDLLVEYLRAKKTIEAPPAGRMVAAGQ